MKQLTGALLLVGTLAVAPAVLARGLVPIVERPNEAVVTSSGKPISNEALKQAIISGGAARKWEVVPAADGKSLRATYRVASKHVVMVDIVPGPDAFSVKYADSEWVGQLVDSIRVELKKL
jgi:hypothetical protein